MASLFFRNLFFTILQPGIVAGLIPFWIAGKEARTILDEPFLSYHYAGIAVFITGFIIMLICIMSFAVQGQGTLSPADPTRKLVVTGLYRFSRNPMYVGVTMMLIGEALFFQSAVLWIYSLLVFTAFNIFILFFEEPRLKRDFREAYDDYCKNVRRWI